MLETNKQQSGTKADHKANMKPIHIIFILLLFSCAGGGGGGSSGGGVDASGDTNQNTFTFTTYPTADTDIFSGAPGYNYGDSSTISVSLDSRSFIKFDLCLIHSNAIIQDATLWLIVAGWNPSGRVKIQRIIGTWGEDQTTWNNQPGCLDNPSKEFTVDGYQGESHIIDITDLIINYGDDCDNDNGLRISNFTDSEFVGVAYYSSEDPNVENRPKLVIKYHVD